MTSQGCDFACHDATQAPCEELRQQQDMGGSPEQARMLDFEKMELGTEVQAQREMWRKGVLERIACPRVDLPRRLECDVFIIGSDEEVTFVIDQHGSSAMGDRDNAAAALLVGHRRELAQQPGLDAANIELLDGRCGNDLIGPLPPPDDLPR